MITFKQYLEAVLAYDDPKGPWYTKDPEPSWMTPDKKELLTRTYENEPKKAMHMLKSWWNQAVDRNFIQSVKTVHYGAALRIDLEIQNNVQDLSCIGYLSPPYKNNWVGNCGIIAKGYVTLAGNSDLQSNQWMSRSSRGQYRKLSEYYRDFITNEKDFIKNKDFNEFLVSNWKPTAVIKSSSRIGDTDDKNMSPEELAEKYNLPLLNKDGKIIAAKLKTV